MSLFAKYVHLVLIEALITAKLQLVGSILKVNVVDRMTHMLAPVTNATFLESGPSTLVEAQFAAESLRFSSRCLQGKEL